MSDYKDLLGIISVLFVIATVIPYYRGMYRGETKPHVFTWLIWTLTCGITGLAMFADGGGPGAWAMTLAGLINAITALLALKCGEKNITRADWVMLTLGLCAIPLWWFTKDPLWSVILLTAIDTTGYVPTFRKSWMKPKEEVALTYFLGGIWQVVSLFALTNYSLTTMLAPISYTIINATLIAFLLIRRKSLA